MKPFPSPGRVAIRGLFLRGSLVAGSAIALAACGRGAPGPTARFYQIARTNITDDLTLSGILESEKKVDLKSEVSGIIKTIYKKEGDRVRKGEAILAIDPLQLKLRLARDKLALERSGIQLLQAKRNGMEAEDLAKAGGISAKERQEIAWAAKLAEIKWKEDNSALEETRYLLGKSEVVSPMDGMITSLAAKEGEVIVSGTASLGGGTLLGTVADLEKMGVMVGVSELDFPFIRKGQSASVATEAQPGVNTRAHIGSISPEARESGEKNIRYFQARIVLDSASPKMVPGISVSVKVCVLSLENVLAAPADLLRSGPADAGTKYAWVLRNGGVTKAPLVIGRTNYLLTEIVSGLSEGEWISSDSVSAPAKPLPGRGNRDERTALVPQG